MGNRNLKNLLRHLQMGNTIETRLRERGSEDKEFFQHWPIIEGGEGADEQEMIGHLYTLAGQGLISRSEEVCEWDQSEYRVTWSC
jgi:hypothetical protein